MGGDKNWKRDGKGEGVCKKDRDRDTHSETEKQLKTDIETESYREKLTKIKKGLYRQKSRYKKTKKGRDYEVETKKDLETDPKKRSRNICRKTERKTFPGTTFSPRIDTFLKIPQDKT